MIFDPSQRNNLSQFRGGERILQVLKENLPEAEFIQSLNDIKTDRTLIVPFWNPFVPPLLNHRLSIIQYLMIFDVIPLKYPSHFPIGVKGSINLWRNKRALKHFDKIITISEHSKIDIVHYLNIPEDKVAVVYPTISKVFINSKKQAPGNKQIPNFNNQNLKMFQASLRPRSERASFMLHKQCFALYVGDVNWNKNLVNLAKAIKLADIPGVFVGSPFTSLKRDNKICAASLWSEPVIPEAAHGSGQNRNERSRVRRGIRVDRARKSLLSTLSHPWQAEFKAFLQEVGDDKRFIFAGYVSDGELIELYRNATCNILVSHDEGFGYSYAEAASQKCPSILSDIPVFHETTADTALRTEPLGGALFANPDDPTDIASKIKQFITNETVRKTLGEKSYKRVISVFSPKAFRQNLLKLLQ